MTEQEEFCGTITMAARRLSIGAQLTEDLVGWSMNWLDPIARTAIRSPSAKDKKEAIYLGCKELTNYLQCQTPTN